MVKQKFKGPSSTFISSVQRGGAKRGDATHWICSCRRGRYGCSDLLDPNATPPSVKVVSSTLFLCTANKIHRPRFKITATVGRFILSTTVGR